MTTPNVRLLYLNLGHFLDHLFMLLYATAVITMALEFDWSYGELLALATPAFIAFGAGALPAGWLGDRWSRDGMMIIFFIGIGSASILTGLASGPLMIGAGLTLIGIFASIYHPVGIAMVADGAGDKTGWRLGVNGVFGNMGVAFAAPVAAGLATTLGWRFAFLVPGLVAILIGIGFAMHARSRSHESRASGATPKRKTSGIGMTEGWQRVMIVLAVSTIFGGIIFNAVTVSLPKVFDERLEGITDMLLGASMLVTVVVAVAAFIQIVVGKLIDIYPIRMVLATIAVLNIPFFLAAVVVTDWAMFFVALAIMFCIFGQIPITDTLVARYTPDRLRSRVYALKYLGTLGVASMSIPLISILHDSGGGFASLFTILAVCATFVAGAAFALPGVRHPRTVALAAEQPSKP
jgi:MFS family permease